MPITSLDTRQIPGDLLKFADVLIQDGVVHLRGAFKPQLLDALYKEYELGLLDVLQGEQRGRILSLGYRRLHVTLPLRGAFLHPDFYANPYVHGICRHILGSEYIAGTLACAISFPEAARQHRHRDQELLFPDPRLNMIIPPVSLCFAIPLAGATSMSCMTEFTLGSHRETNHLRQHPDEDSANMHTAEMDFGDALVWDNRIIHRGRANNAGVIRPLLLLYMQKPWFRNHNLEGEAGLQISRSDSETLSEEYRPCFAWPHQPRRKENRIVAPVLRGSPCPCGSDKRFKHCCGQWTL